MMKTTCVALLLLTACNPTLAPVTARASQALEVETRPARIIWVIDMSGSMALPEDPVSPTCPAGCGPGNACPASCVTRKDQLVEGLGTLTRLLPANATHDLVEFPNDAQCGAPNTHDENISVAHLIARTTARAPIGGTPTAAALNYVAALPTRAVDTFVVLATDGVPNCNATNPNHQCAGPNSNCRCTVSSCATNLCALGCLDDLGAVSASHNVATRGMNLLVLGLGSELRSADQIAPFAAMEVALPRTCSSDLDCVSGCGDAGVCGERLYRVAKPGEYEAPASRLNTAVRRAGRCNWWLPHEVAASDVRVLLERELTTDWRLEAIGGGYRVELTGAACDRLVQDPALTPDIRWLPGSN